MNIAKHTTTRSAFKPAYIGRFAPSPSGKLHFGSLVSAVASYCDAKAEQGKWLVRIEDLDPPREESGASQCILASLESHGLFWDDTALYQSQRLGAYQQCFETLSESIYACDCIRQRILSLNGRYDGHCRQCSPAPTATVAWRLNISQHPHLLHTSEHFEDAFLGHQHLALDAVGDFIIKRKDRLFSYQLAVAIDDAFQQITHVIRGQDLLDSTYRQRYLLLLLQAQRPQSTASFSDNSIAAADINPLPQYGHTPLALGDGGHKLSKQTKACPINNAQAAKNLLAALVFLGHRPPSEFFTRVLNSHLGGNHNPQHCSEILDWAVVNWNRSKVPTDSSVAPTRGDA